MKTKILFLDVDGVLASYLYLKQVQEDCEFLKEFEPSKMLMLKEIVDKSGCNIVISSSWRGNLTLDEWNETFSHFGLGNKIIDITDPDLPKKESVLKWIKERDPRNFIILDDDQLFEINEPIFDRLQKVPKYIGLTEEIKKNILSIFDHSNKKIN